MHTNWLRWTIVVGSCFSFALTAESQLLPRRRPPADAPANQDTPPPGRPLLRGVVDRLTEAAENGEINVETGNPAGEGPGPAPGLFQGLLPLLNGGQNAEPLDPARLNQAIDEELAAPWVEEIEPLESLQLRIDERNTDFAGDRLGLSGAMRLRNTPWQCPAELNLHLRASVENIPHVGPRALISTDIDLLTDTVAMFNSARQMTMRQLRGRSDTSPESADILALLETTPPFHTLGDVADFLPRMGEINLRNANYKVDALRSQIAHAVDAAEERQLIDELAQAYRERDNLLAFSIRSRRNAVLDVVQIEIDLPVGGVSYKMADVEAVHMVVTPGGLSGRVTVGFGQAGVVLYRGAKAVVVEPALRRIQERDPATIERLREQGRQFSEELNLQPRASSGAEELPPPEAR
jgi:hypothetical protein